MNNTRFLFAAATAVLAYLLLTQWQIAHAPPPAPVESAVDAATTGTSAATTAANAELPSANSAAPAAEVPTATATNAQTAVPQPSAPSQERVSVETDVFKLEIALDGADIVSAKLKTYTQSLENKEPVQLVHEAGVHWIKTQSGLIGRDATLPNHLTRFEAPNSALTLGDGQQQLEVPFVWTDGNGLTVRKIYTFERGSFAIKVRFEVDNQSPQALNVFAYRQLQQGEPATPTSSFFASPAGLAYVGSAIFSPDQRFEKLPAGDYEDEPLKRSFVGGWMALLQHHFFVSWIPQPQEQNEYTTAVLPGNAQTGLAYLIRQAGAEQAVAAGAKAEFPATLFIGPKDQEMIAPLAPGLTKVVDYGLVTVISEPLFWFLEKLYKLTGNWGWAIILVVVALKLVFYRLSESQYRSGAKMKALAPKIAEIKKRFPDDAQKAGMAQMELFKKEKVNPLAGCFPVLIQIPVFFGLYWVLAESVEMRQAPFMLWIKDLTAADPFFVLPVLNGVTMFLTSKMTPMTGMDPVQAKIMTYMPLMFAVMMAFFPAGLVLYWTVNGALGLAQQYYITKKIENEAQTPKQKLA